MVYFYLSTIALLGFVLYNTNSLRNVFFDSLIFVAEQTDKIKNRLSK